MPKGHKKDCQCGVCKSKRGERVGVARKPHKAGCSCMCCKAGRGEYKGKKHPTYGTKNPKSKATRKKISNTLKGKPSWNKGKKVPQQSKKNHWNWKGGITSVHMLIRNSPEYKKWRTKVYIRDKFTCQECGQVGGRLEAHHIVGFAEIVNNYPIANMEQALKVTILWDVSNGQTLCLKCHNKTKPGKPKRRR